MLSRVAATCLLFLAAACVNTPDGPRSALMFNRTSLLDAEPADFRAAYQSNFAADDVPADPKLEFRFISDDENTLMNRRVEMEILAQGKSVGHDLPEARHGQAWTIWTPTAQGAEDLKKIQRRLVDFRERGVKGSLRFRWDIASESAKPQDGIAYVTFALQLASDDPWFTLVDNLPVYPEKGEDTK